MAPGFVIRNETGYTYSVSLEQVGPVYSQEIGPGKIFSRDTFWGPFTIAANLNLTGEQKYSDWDVIVPIAQFTAETLFTLYTGGAGKIGSFGQLFKAGVRSTASSATALKGAAFLSRSSFGRALLWVGRQYISKPTGSWTIRIIKGAATGAAVTVATYDINQEVNRAFTDALYKNVYAEENIKESRAGSYSGAYGRVQMYHIIGGPRLPCIDADGNVAIEANELQILNDEECSNNPRCSMD